MSPLLDDLDKVVTEQDLENRGLSIQNIVATLDIEHEIDLIELSNDMESASYEPELSPFVVYRPERPGTVLIPRNGIMSIVGVKSKVQLKDLASHILEELSDLGFKRLPNTAKVRIQNIVVMGQFNQEIDLPVLMAGLGLERAEYEPEQFPGVIYRSDDGATILIFMSGKFLINGKKTYQEADEVVDRMIETFRGIGFSSSLLTE